MNWEYERRIHADATKPDHHLRVKKSEATNHDQLVHASSYYYEVEVLLLNGAFDPTGTAHPQVIRDPASDYRTVVTTRTKAEESEANQRHACPPHLPG